mmetsp:Transcript_31175/g.44806  ORF Transcript_31175/g.44806 Transcript_31175/m.44806 type:complete len:288 (+) Transcript_31175:31-894(+)
MTNISVGFAVYYLEDNNIGDFPIGICEQEESSQGNTGANNMEKKVFTSNYLGTTETYPLQPELKLNSNKTYYIYRVSVRYKYTVRKQAWHNVSFTLCGVNTQNKGIGFLHGEVVFRNPYGFLPALQYGMLPFSGARMVAYVLLFAFFLYCYIINRESTLPLHNAFLVVFLIALTEATLSYSSYQHVNLTGDPFCCPLPSYVVGTFIVQIFRQTLSRSLFLVVSLGYGIVRPKLMKAEWIAVSVVSLLYFITAMVAKVSDIESDNYEASSSKEQQGFHFYDIPGKIIH